MEISAVNAFSALTSNSKIIASTSEAPAVRAVQRVTRRANEVDDSSFKVNSNEQNNSRLQDRITLLGENSISTGKAYGMDISELRNQGLKNQLSKSENSDNQLTADSIDNNSSSENNEVKTENNSIEKEKPTNNSSADRELTEEEQVEVQELKDRDTEVRVHEQAHIAASGGLSEGGASFTYKQGPDGKRYAIGGEVSIDTSEAKTAEETIAKMKKVIRAALAPAEPSSQDRSVAASASQALAQAQMKQNTEGTEETETEEKDKNTKIDTEQTDNNIRNNAKAEDSSINGEDAEQVVESGLIEMPVIDINNISDSNNNNNQTTPRAKLSMQQLAARAAYGISA